ARESKLHEDASVAVACDAVVDVLFDDINGRRINWRRGRRRRSPGGDADAEPQNHEDGERDRSASDGRVYCGRNTTQLDETDERNISPLAQSVPHATPPSQRDLTAASPR